jgi:hypothetical protein
MATWKGWVILDSDGKLISFTRNKPPLGIGTKKGWRIIAAKLEVTEPQD